MKIVTHSPTQLILRDSATALRLSGAGIALFGAVIVWIGFAREPGAGVAMVPAIIGSLVTLGGLAMLLLPARKTFAFSKTDRVVIIAAERFGRVERQTIPLRDVADVSLEESTSSDDGATYRISLTLADQRRIPWTSYYSSGHVAKRAAVDLVREFLELAPSPALASGVGTAKNERDLRNTRAMLLVMGAFCCVFLGVGVTSLVKEQRRLWTFQPVTATVLSTRVEEHSDSDGSTYEPVVVYRYRVAEREYTASRVTPLEESRSGRWASGVTSRYQVGGEYTAYYDAEHPEEAFLLRSRSILPWAFIGIPLIGMLLIIVGYRGSREATKLAYRHRSVG